jgi:hypothetical protein
MRRLNLFLKGNVDLRDTLLFSCLGGKLQWNGLNEVLRQDFPGHLVRIRHETWTRSDALTASDGTIPGGLGARSLPLHAYPLESQFSRKVFEIPSDVVVLSVQPDIFNNLLRHRRDGYPFYAPGVSQWTESDQRWLRGNFEDIGHLDVGTSMKNLARICQEARDSAGARVLVYTVPAAVPGIQIHHYHGLGETLPARIRRFNLALVDLAQELDISVVDVDALVACAGAERVQFGPVHFTAEGCRLVAQEVARILKDLGCFD